MGAVRVHLHHTVRKVQLQRSAIMPDQMTAPVWFVENVLRDHFTRESKDKALAIRTFNQVVKRLIEPNAPNGQVSSTCKGCNLHFNGRSSPEFCSQCGFFFHKSKCWPSTKHSCQAKNRLQKSSVMTGSTGRGQLRTAPGGQSCPVPAPVRQSPTLQIAGGQLSPPQVADSVPSQTPWHAGGGHPASMQASGGQAPLLLTHDDQPAPRDEGGGQSESLQVTVADVQPAPLLTADSEPVHPQTAALASSVPVSPGQQSPSSLQDEHGHPSTGENRVIFDHLPLYLPSDPPNLPTLLPRPGADQQATAQSFPGSQRAATQEPPSQLNSDHAPNDHENGDQT